MNVNIELCGSLIRTNESLQEERSDYCLLRQNCCKNYQEIITNVVMEYLQIQTNDFLMFLKADKQPDSGIILN